MPKEDKALTQGQACTVDAQTDRGWHDRLVEEEAESAGWARSQCWKDGRGHRQGPIAW